MTESNAKYQECSLESLTQQFNDQKKLNSEEAFCFLIGSGASISSGIRSGAKMAQEWWKDINETPEGKEWLKGEWRNKSTDSTEEKKPPPPKELPITKEEAPSFYPHLYRQRFKDEPGLGVNFLRKEMHDKKPNLGYIILAQVLSKAPHNLAITTNFDRLIEDALSYYPSQMPMIIGHESLSGYMQLTEERPTLLKIHHDLLFDPKNKPEDIEALPDNWKTQLTKIISKRRLLVVGYSGNDGSVMDFLKKIAPNDRKPIYWCIRNENELNDKILDLLTSKDRVVTIPGFDELMLTLANKEDMHIPGETKHIEDDFIVQEAQKLVKQLIANKEQVIKNISESKNAQSVKALNKFFGDNWWSVQQKVDETDDIAEKDRLYQRGMQEFPDSHELIGNYALFLHEIRAEYEQAEYYYKEALKLDPDHVNNIGNYANFLTDIRQNHEQAESYYKKALELDPYHANINGNYASFLTDIRQNHEQAESYYKKALELDPNHANTNGNYALFLKNIRKDYEQAEKHYKKALKLDPNSIQKNANYAKFLRDIRQDYDEAEKHYLKALELDPNNADRHHQFAIFLNEVQQDYKQAEVHFKKSLELAPEDTSNNAN